MRRHPWALVPIVACGLAGCADDGRLANPTLALPPTMIQASIAPDGGEAPSFGSIEEVPPEYQGARIISANVRVQWSGSTALAYSSMTYYGNRGEQHLKLQVLHDVSTVGSTELSQFDAALLPSERAMGTPLQFALPNACGQTVNVDAHYAASVVIIANYSWLQVSKQTTNRSAYARQASCSDTPRCDDPIGDDSMTGFAPEGSAVDGVFYNPYDPGEAESTSSSCPGGSSGDSDGSDFASTCSSLGGALSYEFGCLEEWDATTSEWVTVWCGTYAVCET